MFPNLQLSYSRDVLHLSYSQDLLHLSLVQICINQDLFHFLPLMLYLLNSQVDPVQMAVMLCHSVLLYLVKPCSLTSTLIEMKKGRITLVPTGAKHVTNIRVVML